MRRASTLAMMYRVLPRPSMLAALVVLLSGVCFAGLASAQKKQARRPPYLRGHVHIPHGYVLPTTGQQPAILFDKKDSRFTSLYQQIARTKQAHQGSPWTILHGVEALVKKQMKSVGNEVDVRRSNNVYTRFIAAIGAEKIPLSKVADYWALGVGVCREIAAVTQVAVDAAGFPTKFFTGTVIHRTQGEIGRHDVVGVKVDSRWFVIDSVNPFFTGAALEEFMGKGVSDGYVFRPDREGRGAVLHRRWIKDREREDERPDQ